MTADEILRAMTHYGLSVAGPPRGKVAEGSEWHARDNDGTRQGFGSTPAEAVEDAIKAKAIVEFAPEESDDFDSIGTVEKWDFLE